MSRNWNCSSFALFLFWSWYFFVEEGCISLFSSQNHFLVFFFNNKKDSSKVVRREVHTAGYMSDTSMDLRRWAQKELFGEIIVQLKPYILPALGGAAAGGLVGVGVGSVAACVAPAEFAVGCAEILGLLGIAVSVPSAPFVLAGLCGAVIGGLLCVGIAYFCKKGERPDISSYIPEGGTEIDITPKQMVDVVNGAAKNVIERQDDPKKKDALARETIEIHNEAIRQMESFLMPPVAH